MRSQIPYCRKSILLMFFNLKKFLIGHIKLVTLFLKSLIVDNTVYCKGKQKDRYRRLIAVCYSGKVNLNSKMVEEGWAIAYRYYSNDYIFEEEIAKKNKKGIWQGDFIEPYAWRKKQLNLKN